MAEEVGPAGSGDRGRQAAGAEKHIGRRAFLALIAAGVAALFFGREAFSRLSVTPGVDPFRINSIYTPEPIDRDTWRLNFEGVVRQPLDLSWKEFQALPQAEEVRDFTCVEGWTVKAVRWTGVRLRELMDRAGISESATHLVFHSADLQYTDSLTIAEAQADDVLLAYELNGEPLSRNHGFPVRLVVPEDFGYKSVKWVIKIEAITGTERGPDGYRGYWENRGYSPDASIG